MIDITEFIRIANIKHGNKYDYSKVNYINSKTKVTIICPKHGEFKQTFHSHCIKGSNCAKCYGRLKMTNVEFIKKAIEVNGNKYDYSKVNYENNKTNIIIICPKHGEFTQNPYNHLNGFNGCKKCNGGMIDKKIFIKRSKEIHNNKYDYSEVNYINTKTKVNIKCNIHGLYSQLPSVHTSGSGCPKCGKESGKNKKTYTNNKFIEKAKKIHGNKYDYSEVIYKNRDIEVIIICPEHGKYMQKPKHHFEGFKCSKCSYCPNCYLFRTFGKLCKYCKPQKENKLYQKTKEFKAVEYLRENIDKDFIHNESVGSDCTKNDRKNTNGHIYPDIKFDCIWFQLIVEIDEHQHRGAGYKCEKRRMYDIIAKLGMSCVFIRYNPDNKDSNLKTLEDKINKYLEYEKKINSKELKFDDFGYKCEYLFYK